MKRECTGRACEGVAKYHFEAPRCGYRVKNNSFSLLPWWKSGL
jgi:hypothetical protein